MLVGVWDRCGFQGHIGFVGCSRGWEFEIYIWGNWGSKLNVYSADVSSIGDPRIRIRVPGGSLSRELLESS